MSSVLVGQDACKVRWTPVTRTCIQSAYHDPKSIQKYSPKCTKNGLSETQKSLSSFWGGTSPSDSHCWLNNISLRKSSTIKIVCNFSTTLWKVYEADTYNHIPSMRTFSFHFKFVRHGVLGYKIKKKQCHVPPIKKLFVTTHLWKQIVTTQQWKK